MQKVAPQFNEKPKSNLLRTAILALLGLTACGDVDLADQTSPDQKPLSNGVVGREIPDPPNPLQWIIEKQRQSKFIGCIRMQDHLGEMLDLTPEEVMEGKGECETEFREGR